MHHNPLTADQLKARQSERHTRETMQLEALHEALGLLIAARKSSTDMMSDKVLWGDWLFAKALHDVFGDDCSARALQEACDNLGVDEDGCDLALDPADYGDYLYEQRRDRQLDEQMVREVAA